jgi:hypothetical protein
MLDWLEEVTAENAVSGSSNFARFLRRVLHPGHSLESIEPPASSRVGFAEI